MYVCVQIIAQIDKQGWSNPLSVEPEGMFLKCSSNTDCCGSYATIATINA
ncbi:MAG: hypothetical protein ACI92E_001490 [Oceanicoccus sp.]|jgi:hypothetical protein